MPSYAITSLLLAASLIGSPRRVHSWLNPSQNLPSSLLLRSNSVYSQKSPTTPLYLSAESEEERDGTNSTPDFAGKAIFQRTFYRLSAGSKVAKPNALVIEERLRYRPDPDNSKYILPHGPRTFILREGTEHDEITDELYRMDIGSTAHNGPGSMDTTIATILFLASNPQIIQGNVLEVGCDTGLVGLLGCIAAHYTSSDADRPAIESQAESADTEGERSDDDGILTVPQQSEPLFPPRLKHLTLSDESQDRLSSAYDIVRNSRIPPAKVSLKELNWSVRDPMAMRARGGTMGGGSIGPSYRTIVGSDVDFSYPSAKELARTVANSLLPSNPVAIESVESAESSSSSGSSFGALGMDEGSFTPPPSLQEESDEVQIDSNIPPAFVHVCPEYRENLPYLRQFLEKGFKMNVDLGYLKLQKLRFVYQMVPDDDESEVDPEAQVEDLDLELQDESSSVYESLTAVHNPDYAGAGSGEYFFPMETGEYEGGSRSTYLEPEEGTAI